MLGFLVIKSARFKFYLGITIATLFIAAGCQEIDTVKRELLKKAQGNFLKKKNPFVPRDGITIRQASLYQTANFNSEIMNKLPAETPVNLLDKVGEFYRIRTRDGKEGYVEQKVVGGEDILLKTQELRKSIEGMPPQAEGVIKTKANFRLEPGRNHEVIEILPAGKKFEVYERIVTVRPSAQSEKIATRGRSGQIVAEEVSGTEDVDDLKKDVWYKVKIEDGRVGYIYTHNMVLTPPEDLAKLVPFLRLVGWRPINGPDDPDLGAKNNYIVAYAPIGKDPGCDYTKLYYVAWSTRLKKRTIAWRNSTTGVLPITNYRSEGRPGFSIRSLHPTKKDKLVLSNYVLLKGNIKNVGEEEIPNLTNLH